MKNSIYTFGFLTIIFFISSCGSTSNSNSSTITNPHAEEHLNMHKEFKQEQLQKEIIDKNKEMTEPSKAQKQKFLMKKHQKGIGFYAIGNEPFWSLNIDFKKGFQFDNLDGLKFSAPMVKPEKAMDANIIRYRSITESGEIIIQLNQIECSDTMSGQKFNYNVTIDLKTNKDSDYKTYKGCGDFIPDFRLHNIWVIVEVDGLTIKPENFKNKIPSVEIFISEEKVLGHDGCNSFSGSAVTENGKIIFGNLISTMMACSENTKISSSIGKVLSGNSLQYKFESNQLVFYQNGKKVMVLKNVD